jgi:hypothetical protein
VDKRGGEADQTAVSIDSRRLHGCDLMLTEALADQIEPGGERRIAKGPVSLARELGDDGCGQGFFRICDFGLRLGKALLRVPRRGISCGVAADGVVRRAVELTTACAEPTGGISGDGGLRDAEKGGRVLRLQPDPVVDDDRVCDGKGTDCITRVLQGLR